MASFVGENRLTQVLQSVLQKIEAATEDGFKTMTVASQIALEALTTGEGGQDGNTIYLVGAAAPYAMFIWNGTVYVAIGAGGGTIDSELTAVEVDDILDDCGFPKQLP